MQFNPFFNPFSRRNMGPWKVEDLVSPLGKTNQCPQKKVDFTLQLDSFPGSSQEKKGIPRVPGHCDMCLVDETPLWRSGPNGPKTLCNACGLRYSKELKKVELVLGEKAKPSTGDASSSDAKPKKPKKAKTTKKQQQ